MKPSLFIGSSVESRKIAYAIQQNLEYDVDSTVWTQGVFKLSRNTLNDLVEQLSSSDYAVFVFSPDDITTMRDKTNSSVRDNVVFEMGLFIGRIGIERVYFVIPSEDNDLHLPTDLLGITPGRFDNTRSDTAAALGSFCNQVRERVEKLGRITPIQKEVYSENEVKEGLIYTEEHRILDKKIALNIKRMLPVNGAMNFLREHNFAGAYHRDYLKDLDNIYFDGNNVDFEFINQDLENLRTKLMGSIGNLIGYLAHNTWVVNNTNAELSSVPSEWEYEQPERFREVTGKIEKIVSDICSTYDQLMRKARSILAV